MKYFETKFLDEAREFILQLDKKVSMKVLYNIDSAEKNLDPKLFKKLKNDICEFRVRYAGNQIRLLAFWDKSDNKQTLVFATHGFIKKFNKIPSNEIDRANRIKVKYFESKIK